MTTPTDTRLHQAESIYANAIRLGLIDPLGRRILEELFALIREAERDLALMARELEDALRDAPPLTGPGGF